MRRAWSEKSISYELTVVSSRVVQAPIGRLHDVELGQLQLALVADGVVGPGPDVVKLVDPIGN